MRNESNVFKKAGNGGDIHKYKDNSVMKTWWEYIMNTPHHDHGILSLLRLHRAAGTNIPWMPHPGYRFLRSYHSKHIM